jgi:hypothetical protein
MKSAKSNGRAFGILLLLQLAAALTLPFILMKPLTTSSLGFLTAAAENSVQVRTGVVIAFIGAALTVSLGITAWPVFRRFSNVTALAFLAACLISCVLDIMHNAAVMSMLSVSQQYLNGGGAETRIYQVAGGAVASVRRWVHFSQLLAIGSWIFIFYSSLLRFALIPRPLAILGLIGIILQFTGVTLMMLLGYNAISELAMPLLPIQIITAGWLIVKGFNERNSQIEDAENQFELAEA